MRFDLLNPKRARRIFATMLLVSIWFIADIPSAATPPPPPRAQFGDRISPGFFNPPPGIRPVNAIRASRIPNARRSYAWRFRGANRELLTFSTPIQHVVVIYMENRTPENLFAAFYSRPNPATGKTFGSDLDLVDPQSLPSKLPPEPLWTQGNPGHQHWPEFYSEAMGTYGPSSGYWYVELPTMGPGLAASSTATYITLIEDWAYENHTLQSNEGPSFESHQYAIAGQSGGLPGSNLAPNGMFNNPAPKDTAAAPGNGTCFSTLAKAQTVSIGRMYSPAAYPTPMPSPSTMVASPCNDYLTIFDVLQNAQPSPLPSAYDLWQYVAMDQTSIWSAPMSVQHLYGPYASASPNTATQPFNVDPDAENFVLNIAASPSPAPSPRRPFAELTFLTPCLGESDHPNTAAPKSSSYDDGPDWLAYVLNAIGNSPYWQNTAVIVTWDDWGGFYDNFTPSPWPYHPTGNPYSSPRGGNPSDPNEWGFRVPLMLISPYVTSKGYISTNIVSQGAILNFIQTVFNLGPYALGGDDATNAGHDLTDMINASASPKPWIQLPTGFTPQNNDRCPTPSPIP